MAASYSSGWAWCNRCECLFLADVPGAWACAAGGDHDSTGSGDYFMLLIDDGVALALPGQQLGWSVCDNCHALFYGPFVDRSSCPAGGRHTGGGYYAMQFDDGSSPSNQQGWRWCKNCQSLFYALDDSPGPCPAGAGWLHDPSASGNYDLPFAGVPWIGTYTFNDMLMVEGSNYTLGGQVDVFTRYSDGTGFHHERVKAIENQAAPGGWISAGTNSHSAAGPDDYNGYVQAHDLASNKWSPKLPIIISVRIDP